MSHMAVDHFDRRPEVQLLVLAAALLAAIYAMLERDRGRSRLARPVPS
jgi:hypothetical protein